MKTITFIRHGQSVANAGGLTVAHHAIPLSGLGELQADVLSTLLPAKPTLILTSSFLREQQTASPFEQRIGLAATRSPFAA